MSKFFFSNIHVILILIIAYKLTIFEINLKINFFIIEIEGS